MAYQEQLCGSMLEVPGIVAAFAQTLGWQVSGAGASRTIRRPIEPDENDSTKPDADIRSATTWSLVAAVENYTEQQTATSQISDHYMNIRPVGFADSSERRALVASPRFGVGNRYQPQIPLPTKVHLFGAALPEPFIAGVIEYSFNLYRPFYIGSMDRLGQYGPGDVASCALGNRMISSNSSREKRSWQGMFSGSYNSHLNETVQRVVGGLVHDRGGLDAVPGYRPFAPPIYSPGASAVDRSFPDRIFGGPRDGVHDALVSHGYSPFSGENFLAPVNLYQMEGVQIDARVVALGMVRGVRGVNMLNLDPGAPLVVGNKRWRAFPQLSKKLFSDHAPGPRHPNDSTINWRTFPVEDTSHLWGFAFLEGDA